MAGVYKLDIQESEADLKQLLRRQKTASAKERVQLLYLLKTQQAGTVQQAAEMLGRHRVTVQEWLQRYRQGGLNELLSHRKPSGRRRTIPRWAEDTLNQRLQEPQGFESYGAICEWLETYLGVKAPYKTVYQLVRYRLQAAPKVPRPVSDQQLPEQVEAYKKTS